MKEYNLNWTGSGYANGGATRFCIALGMKMFPIAGTVNVGTVGPALFYLLVRAKLTQHDSSILLKLGKRANKIAKGALKLESYLSRFRFTSLQNEFPLN